MDGGGRGGLEHHRLQHLVEADIAMELNILILYFTDSFSKNSSLKRSRAGRDGSGESVGARRK